MGAEETRSFHLCYLLQYLQLHLRLILPLLQMQKLRLRGVIWQGLYNWYVVKARPKFFYS